MAKLHKHTHVCTKFSLTQEFADFKISNTFLCNSVHKASFITGVGARSHNYSYDPENFQLMKSKAKPHVKVFTYTKEVHR